MLEPTHADAFAVLCLQAADDGRGPVLLGEGVDRARELARPFLIGARFPETYLELPLTGEPFMDVTLLLEELEPGARVASPLADGTHEALGLYARWLKDYHDISCGYELDCHDSATRSAALHFQPRAHHELVRPFCAALGEPERAELYLAQDARMPHGWPLSFFGLFRGRAQAPLRVCGYLDKEEQQACVRDPERLGRALERAGLGDFGSEPLAQAACVLALAPDYVDFQLDVLPDGSLGDSFAFDVHFDRMRSSEVRAAFADGSARPLVEQLKAWGIADDRVEMMPELTLNRGLPVVRADGSSGVYGFSIAPGWLKVRWRAGVLQPAKMYLRCGAGMVRGDEGAGPAPSAAPRSDS